MENQSINPEGAPKSAPKKKRAVPRPEREERSPVVEELPSGTKRISR